MPDFVAGTYPYRNRHAIMEAVQAGLLPHARQAGDDVHQGCVTVIVRVTAPQTAPKVERPIGEGNWGTDTPFKKEFVEAGRRGGKTEAMRLAEMGPHEFTTAVRTQAFAEVRRVVEELAIWKGGNKMIADHRILAALDALERGP